MKIPLSLGRDHAARKALPIMRVLGYFTAAFGGLTRHAVRGNAQHNGTEALHWARGKSADHAECVGRHSFDMMDYHAWLERNPKHPEREAVLAELEQEYDARLWRAAADSQEFYEKYRGAPVSPSSVLPVVPEGPAGAYMAQGMEPPEPAPVLDYSHELTHHEGYRLTFPPFVENPHIYPSVWRGSSGYFYANGDTLIAENTRGDLRRSYPTEAEARAAYWRWKGAQPVAAG